MNASDRAPRRATRWPSSGGPTRWSSSSASTSATSRACASRRRSSAPRRRPAAANVLRSRRASRHLSARRRRDALPGARDRRELPTRCSAGYGGVRASAHRASVRARAPRSRPAPIVSTSGGGDSGHECSLYAFAALLAAVAPAPRSACGSEARSASPQQAGNAAPPRSAKAEFTVETTRFSFRSNCRRNSTSNTTRSSSRVRGHDRFAFRELGDRVSAGERLARMESAEQEIALASAEAALDNLNRAATRSRTLTKSGGIDAADSEQVEFQLRQADIARRKARRDVELTRIVAPFAGVVTSRVARPSRFVAVGDTLYRVTEQAPLFARVRIPESSARGLRVGESRRSSLAAGESSPARIVHAAPFVDAASGTREIVLRVGARRRRIARRQQRDVRLGREGRRVTACRARGRHRRLRCRRRERTQHAAHGDARPRRWRRSRRGAERTLARASDSLDRRGDRMSMAGPCLRGGSLDHAAGLSRRDELRRQGSRGAEILSLWIGGDARDALLRRTAHARRDRRVSRR